MSKAVRPLAAARICAPQYRQELVLNSFSAISHEFQKRRPFGVHRTRRVDCRHYSISKACSFTATTDRRVNRSPDSSSIHALQRARSRSLLITGGTSGIGFAVAKQAILHGASHVRIITRDAQRGREAIDRLRQETATANTQTELDYVEADTIAYAELKLFRHEGRDTAQPQFSTVIHCAGITQTSLLTSTTTEGIQQILSTNLESTALLSKNLLKRYMQTCMTLNQQHHKSSSPPPPITRPPSWQLITISSLLALKRGTGSSIYAASKAGIIALTRSVALEGAEISRRYPALAPGFRANVIVPGYIATPMTKSIAGSSKEKLIDEIPTGRFGTPDEVADAVMFLLQNEYANNCVLNLDGGLSAT